MAGVAKILSNLRKDEGKAEKACQIKLEQPLCIESNLQWTILSRRDKVQQCTRLRRRMEKQRGEINTRERGGKSGKSQFS